jgi:hypothetical protein
MRLPDDDEELLALLRGTIKKREPFGPDYKVRVAVDLSAAYPQYTWWCADCGATVGEFQIWEAIAPLWEPHYYWPTRYLCLPCGHDGGMKMKKPSHPGPIELVP